MPALACDGMYISVEQISKRYDGRAGPIDALAPLSFEVDENEFVSIVGPSGCGKSTLLMIISGLLRSQLLCIGRDRLVLLRQS